MGANLMMNTQATNNIGKNIFHKQVIKMSLYPLLDSLTLTIMCQSTIQSYFSGMYCTYQTLHKNTKNIISENLYVFNKYLKF